MTDEQKAARAYNSQKLARGWQQFIQEHTKRGHVSTVARAIIIASLQLKGVMDKETFDRDAFLLEIDKIINELGITGDWFWRDR